MPTTLQWLLDPISGMEFREQYYGKRPLVVRGLPKKFGDLFTWDDLNRLLNTSPYPQPNMEVSTPDKRSVSPAPYTILEECRAGATLIIHHLHLCDPKVGELTRALETEIGESMTVGLFLSQPSRAALARHYDRTDVFVLQIAGHKAWSIYDRTVEKPILGTAPSPHESSPSEPTLQCELNAGDVLYVPRGYWHEALAQRELSLHLTFAVRAQTGIDFLKWLVDELTSDVRFRHELPVSFAEEPKELHEERVREHVVELGEILLSRLNEFETIRSYIEHLVVADRDVRRFKLPAQILEAPTTQLDVRRFSRPARQRFVLNDGPTDDLIALSVWGHIFHFPKTARPLIEFIVSQTAFAYEDVLAHAGVLTTQGVLEVLDPLLREGILDAAPGP